MATLKKVYVIEFPGLTKIVDNLTDATTAMSELDAEIERLTESLEDPALNADQIDAITASIESLLTQSLDVGEAIDEATQATVGFSKAAGVAGSSVEGLAGGLTDVGDKFDTITGGAVKAGRTVADMERDFEELTSALKEVPAGTAEFNTIIKRMAGVKTELALVDKALENLDPEKKAKAIVDVFDQLGSGFEQATFAVQAFGGESEETAQILKEVEKFMFLVGAAKQLVDAKFTLGGLQGVKANKSIVKSEKEKQGAIGETTEAVAGTTAATVASAAAADIATVAFNFMKAALISTGIGGLIVGAVALGVALYALLTNIEPIIAGFKTMGDIVGAVLQGVKAFASGVEGVIKAFVNFDFTAPLESFKKAGDDIAKAGKDALDKGTAEFVRAQKERKLIAEGVIRDIANIGKQADIATLSRNEATNARSLEAQAEVAKAEVDARRELLQTQLKLTDEELAILQSGDEKRIAGIRATLKKKGVLEGDGLQQVKDLADAEIALADKVKSAKDAVIDNQQKALDANKSLQDAVLAGQEASINFSVSTAAKKERIASDLAKTLEDIAIREAKGEAILDEERQTANVVAANAATALAREVASVQLDLAQRVLDANKALQDALRSDNESSAAKREQIDADLEKAQADFRLRERNGEKVLEAEKQTAEVVAAKAREALAREVTAKELELSTQVSDAEIASLERLIEKNDDMFERITSKRSASIDEIRSAEGVELKAIKATGEARLAQLEGERLIIEANKKLTDVRETERQLKDLAARELEIANKLTDDKIALEDKTRERIDEANARSFEAQRTEIQLRADASATASELLQRRSALESEALTRSLAVDSSITNQRTVAAEQTVIIAKETKSITDDLKLQADLQTQILDLQIAEIQAKELNKTATEEEIKQLGNLTDQKANVKLGLAIDTEEAQAEAAARGKEVTEAFKDSVKASLTDPLGTTTTNFLKKALSATDEDVQFLKDNLSKAAEQAFAFLDQLDAARVAALDARKEDNDKQIEAIDEAVSESESRIQELQGVLDANADAGTSRSLAAQGQLDAEAAKTDALKKERQSLAIESKKIEAEQAVAQEASSKRQEQITALTNLATAAAMTQNVAAAFFPDPASEAAPFGIGLAVRIAAALAFVTSMFSAIQSTRSAFAERGGVLNDDGSLTSFADGGVVYGNSHAQGGVRGTGRFNNVEVEGGEFIVNKAATARHFGMLYALNESAKPMHFEGGGALPTLRSDLNLGIRGDTGISANDLKKLISLLTENRKLYISVDDMRDGERRVNTAERRGRLL